ncbi:hypothetical protein KP509_12G072700 [Ceratopteris richardii]|nr:hypothetical protein KP509_12G072700 [Ceratopteris richardii]
MMLPEESEPWLPAWEDLNSPLLMLSPLLLLLLVRLLGSSRLRFDADASSIHRVGGSPSGLLIILLLVVGMISFRSLIQNSISGSSEDE